MNDFEQDLQDALYESDDLDEVLDNEEEYN